MKAAKEKYESVKIESEIMDRVRRYVKQSRQTISGFISSELEIILDSKERIGHTLHAIKESNKKKK